MLTPRLRHREARLFLPAEPLRRFLGRTTELLVLAMALRALVMAAGKLVAACAAVSATMPIVFEMEAACAMMAVAGRDTLVAILTKLQTSSRSRHMRKL